MTTTTSTDDGKTEGAPPPADDGKTEGAPPPAAKTDDGKTDDGKTPPAKPPAGSPEALRAELADERRRRQAAERKAGELEREKMSADERAVADAKDAGRAEARGELLPLLVKSEVRSLAKGKVSDPEDVIALLGDLTRFAKDNEIDTKTIAAEIDALVKAKPYLAAGENPPPRRRGLPGGAGSAPTGTSINDDIRQLAGRGRAG